MSFLDYLNDHRGQFIDHRVVPPSGGRSSSEQAQLEQVFDTPEDDVTGSAWPGRRRRARGAGRGSRAVRFRQLRPLQTTPGLRFHRTAW